MAVCQNLVPLVNIKIAGKWMFIPLKMVLIGIDPYPYMIIYKGDLFRGYYHWHPRCIPEGWPERPPGLKPAVGEWAVAPRHTRACQKSRNCCEM